MRSVLAAVLLVAAPASAVETIKFDSLDGAITGGKPTAIEAKLFKPSGAGPFPAIVMLHGCGGLYHRQGASPGHSLRFKPEDQLSANHADWAGRMQAAGYVVLLPDSFGPRGVSEICTLKDPPVTAIRERTRDAYGALLWLQSQSFVKPDRVALMGWSNGGGTVMRTIEAKSGARPASLPKGDFRAAVAFYPGCLNPKRSKEGREWRTRIPLIILFGADDDWVSVEPCRNLVEAAAKRGEAIEFIAYPGAYHGFDAPDIPVRIVRGLARAASGSAHVGTNKAARADAIQRVPEFLRVRFGA
jgi:dienelactone hydrolase